MVREKSGSMMSSEARYVDREEDREEGTKATGAKKSTGSFPSGNNNPRRFPSPVEIPDPFGRGLHVISSVPPTDAVRKTRRTGFPANGASRR